jgi:hypothetical protein
MFRMISIMGSWWYVPDASAGFTADITDVDRLELGWVVNIICRGSVLIIREFTDRRHTDSCG